ncbi:MAG: glycosyltransferase family 2 protein [Methanobacterium sp.]|nr:glycosyltransferase family 2 protein [Methanobacterium sp.]
MNLQVAIIILNWNGWEDTIECLESLYQNNHPTYNVIVVDNHSEDKSIERIKQYCHGELKISSNLLNYPKNNKSISFIHLKESNNIVEEEIPNKTLIIMENKENQGFARGNNTGIKFALKHLTPQYILLLNNDTVVDSQFLTELIKTANSDDNTGIVGPKTYLYNDKKVIQAAGGGNIDLSRGESHEVAFMEEDDGEFDKLIELDYVGGSCLLIKRDVIEKVGLLDERYFMYWEDVDWSFNAREAGYKSIYSFKSKIWHKYGTSSKDYFKTYYHNRNRIFFEKKHAPKEYYRKFIRYYCKEIITESLYQLFYQRNWKMFKSLLKGSIDGIRLKK